MNIASPSPDPWQPPSDYMQVESQLEGVQVYAPRPKEDLAAAPKTYTCPNCGQTTRYDVSAGGVVCEYCGYSVAVDAIKVGRRADESEFTVEVMEDASHGWGVSRQVLHCENCGAELAVAPDQLTASCPYCGSNKVNVRQASSDKLRPRFLIPFKVKREDVRKRAAEWLGKGWFHPKDLSANVLLDRFVGVYMPFWTFDARLENNWRAEVGHEHTTHDKDGHPHTHIDWSWKDGAVTVNVDDMMITGNSHISHLILSRIHPFDLNALETYSPDFLAGWHAQAYDVTLPAAWDEARARMRERAKDACYGDIHSSHVRNFSMNSDFADEAWRYILLPIYLASYKYEERAFQVMVNGQTGKVAGQKPVSWLKVWLAIAALLSPGLVLGLIGLATLSSGRGMIPLLAGFGLVIVGLILAVILYRKAVDSEAA
jgi:DNA-directed RNA polymerase subunit RPC12/RpoP